MVQSLINLITEPFFISFSELNLDSNLLQAVLILIVVIGVINWILQLFTY